MGPPQDLGLKRWVNFKPRLSELQGKARCFFPAGLGTVHVRARGGKQVAYYF